MSNKRLSVKFRGVHIFHGAANVAQQVDGVIYAPAEKVGPGDVSRRSATVQLSRQDLGLLLGHVVGVQELAETDNPDLLPAFALVQNYLLAPRG